MHSRRAHDLDYSNLSVNELCRISPDMRKGLKQLHPKMTWHAVEELFEVDPFLWSMHYCLCDSALRLMSKRGMKVVDIDVAALRASLFRFRDAHGFAPSPRVLLGLKRVPQPPTPTRRCLSLTPVTDTVAPVDSPAAAGNAGSHHQLQQETAAAPAANPQLQDAGAQAEEQAQQPPTEAQVRTQPGARRTQEDADPALALRELYPGIQSWRSEMQRNIEADDMLAAAKSRDHLQTLKTRIAELSVCAICCIERPSTAAVNALAFDKWYGTAAFPVCAYCRHYGRPDPADREHRRQAEESLKLRVWSELLMARRQLPPNCTRQLLEQLSRYTQNLRPHVGRGKGVRITGKTPPLAALVSQLHRTCDRLAPETNLRQAYAALRLVLRGLQVR